MMEAGKQAKIARITESYEQELANTMKTLKWMEEIKVELNDITETYQRNVLEKTDELE